MFVKFRNIRVNFDNVTNYWFQEDNGRYLLNIEYVGHEGHDQIEFKNKEDWESAKTLLDTLIKPFDFYFEKESD